MLVTRAEQVLFYLIKSLLACRSSNSSSSSKGPKSKKFRRSTKPSARLDRSKHKGRSSFGFKRKQNPFWKKKGPRGIYKKSGNVKRTETESEGTLQESSKKTTFEGKFFRRHKPLAGIYTCRLHWRSSMCVGGGGCMHVCLSE